MAVWRVRLSMVSLVAVPLAWLPGGTLVRTVRGRTARAATARGESPRCAGVEYAGRCLPRARCGVDELDLDGACVPSAPQGDGALSNVMETNAHVDRTGRRVIYEHLPRRPDLPADYDRYVYPVPPYGAQTVTSGYDLDRPDERQRRGATLSATGHGAVDLSQERGTPVRVVSLRAEVGEPEVVYVGELFGNTVVLRHVVREGDATQTYLALHGHLESAAPGLVRGAVVREGTTIGFVGDSGAIGVVHLHYEVRLVRAGIDPMRLDGPMRLVDQDVSVPCDPRNVLPFR